jgi:hypothetical protein
MLSRQLLRWRDSTLIGNNQFWHRSCAGQRRFWYTRINNYDWSLLNGQERSVCSLMAWPGWARSSERRPPYSVRRLEGPRT